MWASQNLKKKINWHHSCFRKATTYSFHKICTLIFFSKGCCKDSSYTVNIIEKLGKIGHLDKNTMDSAAKQIPKARERYWMHELWNIFLRGRNDRIGDEFETDNTHNTVASKFSYLPWKHSHANRGKNHKDLPLLLPQQF